MQGASVDSQGRLRVVNAAPSALASFNAGFAFEPDGRLCVATGGGNLPFNNAVLTGNDGRMGVVGSQAATCYNKGWPQTDSGLVIQHLDVAVPAGTGFNAGIAMDSTGVYMTTV
jgi:hypothetical protein